MPQPTSVPFNLPESSGEAQWRGNAAAYVRVRTALVGAIWAGAILAAVGILLALRPPLPGQWVGWTVICAAALWGGWLTATEPRRVRAMGYLLRDDDVVFGRGLWFRRFVAVPFGRLQLVELAKGPIARLAGVSKVTLVTASAGTDADMPGLSDAEAVALRDQLISLAESRRAGL